MKKTNTSEIINIATELFREKGYNASSISDIAEKAGLQKSSIYSHFNGKEDILLQAVNTLSEQFRQNVLSIAYDKNFTPHQRLKKIIDIIEEIYFVKKGCVLGNLSLEISNTIPKVREAIHEFFVEWAKDLAFILKEEYGNAKAKAMGEDIVIRIEGAIMWMRISNDTSVFKRTCREIRSLC